METVETAEKTTLYDLYMLLSPSSMESDFSELENKITGELENHGAQIKKQGKFVKKDLAYPIDKNTYAYAASAYFEADPSAISEIEESLKLSDIPFLRFMVAKAPENALKAPKPKKDIELPEIPELSESQADTDKKTDPEKSQGDNATGKSEQKEEKASETKTTKEEAAETAGEDAEPEKKGENKEEKVTIEDIDKRLDEIMGDL